MNPILSGAAVGIFVTLLFINGHLTRIVAVLEKIAQENSWKGVIDDSEQK